MSSQKSTIINTQSHPVTIVVKGEERILPPRYRGEIEVTSEEAQAIRAKGITLKEGK